MAAQRPALPPPITKTSNLRVRSIMPPSRGKLRSADALALGSSASAARGPVRGLRPCTPPRASPLAPFFGTTFAHDGESNFMFSRDSQHPHHMQHPSSQDKNGSRAGGPGGGAGGEAPAQARQRFSRAARYRPIYCSTYPASNLSSVLCNL